MIIKSKTNMDCYKFYKEKTSTPVDLPTYRTIVNAFAKFIMRKIFAGYEVQLSGGESLGTLSIVGRKQKIEIDENGNVKGLVINWRLTRQMWEKNPELKLKEEKFYYTNEHTNGVTYSFHWKKEDARLINKYFYAFIPSRANKREMAKHIKVGTEYMVKQNRTTNEQPKKVS